MADVDGNFIGLVSASNPGYGSFLISGTLQSSSSMNASSFIILPAPIIVSITTTYFKRGYYVAGHVFEFWKSTDVTAGPPSGHTLVDIVVVQRIVS